MMSIVTIFMTRKNYGKTIPSFYNLFFAKNYKTILLLGFDFSHFDIDLVSLKR